IFGADAGGPLLWSDLRYLPKRDGAAPRNRNQDLSGNGFRVAAKIPRVSQANCVSFAAFDGRRYRLGAERARNHVLDINSVYPRMALRGVRSSELMLARNCDLCLLASANSRPFSSISRNSRAFWIASTDWSANVSRRSIVLLANSPGVLRRTTRAPTT